MMISVNKLLEICSFLVLFGHSIYKDRSLKSAKKIVYTWAVARKTIQAVLESTQNDKSSYWNINLKLTDTWKSLGAMENEFLVLRDLLHSKFQ